jgi:hypothetical protein
LLPQLTDQGREALGPDPHLECVLLHVDPPNEQRDDPRLLGRKQLVPDRGEVGEQEGDLALGDVLIALALRRQVLPTSSGRRAQL